MAFYRKKPIVIEAVHWLGPQGGGVTVDELKKWGCNVWPTDHWAENDHDLRWALAIATLADGSDQAVVEHIVSEGDWIVRGVQGEFYPCTPDVFSATYEVVDDITDLLDAFDSGQLDRDTIMRELEGLTSE